MAVHIQQVASKAIRLVGYSEEKKDLLVSFTSGRTYFYSKVAKADFDAFIKAPSIGTHHANHIKPNFPCRECVGTEAEAIAELKQDQQSSPKFQFSDIVARMSEFVKEGAGYQGLFSI